MKAMTKKEKIISGRIEREGRESVSQPEQTFLSPKSGVHTGWKHPGGKLLACGAESLTDAELLAILLGTGMKGKPAETLASEILSRYGTLEQAILHLSSAVGRFKGIGKVKSVRLAAIKELLQRLFPDVYLRESLGTPSPPLFEVAPSKPTPSTESAIQGDKKLFFQANHITIIHDEFSNNGCY